MTIRVNTSFAEIAALAKATRQILAYYIQSLSRGIIINNMNIIKEHKDERGTAIISAFVLIGIIIFLAIITNY